MKKKNILIGALVTVVTMGVALSAGIMSRAAGTEEVPVVITCSTSGISADGEGVTIDGSTVTITEAGYYSISGTISDGQIVVNADHDNDTVYLTLNGVSVSNSDGAPFYVVSANKTHVILAEGTTNTFTDTANYVFADGEDEPNATIFAQDDMILKGDGKLVVDANYNHGINGKDDLKIKSGTYVIDAPNDGIKGKDSLIISGGTFNVTSGDDAIKSYNDEDTTKGYMEISDGTFQISAGDDALKAETYLTISETANLNITKSYEGIEALTINLAGGTVSLVSSDDGINASGATASDSLTTGGDAMINITGGVYYVNASGDGIDANGSITMSGGEVYVDGPTDNGNAAIDYNGTYVLTGGKLIAAGSSGMAQAPSTSGTTQYVISIKYSSTQAAKTAVVLKNGAGTELVNYVPKKAYQSVVISTPDLAANTSYSLYSGTGTTAVKTFTLSSIVTAISATATGSGSSGSTTTGNSITVYYKSSWSTAYIHYKIGNGSWTTAPGVQMSASSVSGYYTKTISLGTATTFTCCFNNGSGTWDNNSGNNYYLSAVGTYTIKNGVITKSTP